MLYRSVPVRFEVNANIVVERLVMQMLDTGWHTGHWHFLKLTSIAERIRCLLQLTRVLMM